MDLIIGRCLTPLNSARTIGSVRRRDDNSRARMPNVRVQLGGLARKSTLGQVFAHNGPEENQPSQTEPAKPDGALQSLRRPSWRSRSRSPPRGISRWRYALHIHLFTSRF